MKRILFVCLGNICRSPAAEGVLKHLIKNDPRYQDLQVASCGMGDWHIGHSPDIRMTDAAKGRGIRLAGRAQRFIPAYFDEYDYIFAADQEVLRDLYRHAEKPEHKAKVHLITAFSTTYKNEEIPDPYYEGDAAFELVLDMLEDSCRGFLDQLDL